MQWICNNYPRILDVSGINVQNSRRQSSRIGIGQLSPLHHPRLADPAKDRHLMRRHPKTGHVQKVSSNPNCVVLCGASVWISLKKNFAKLSKRKFTLPLRSLLTWTDGCAIGIGVGIDLQLAQICKELERNLPLMPLFTCSWLGEKHIKRILLQNKEKNIENHERSWENNQYPRAVFTLFRGCNGQITGAHRGPKSDHIRNERCSERSKNAQSQVPLRCFLTGADGGIVAVEVGRNRHILHLMKQRERFLPHGPLLTCSDAGTVANDVGHQSGQWDGMKVVQCKLLGCYNITHTVEVCSIVTAIPLDTFGLWIFHHEPPTVIRNRITPLLLKHPACCGCKGADRGVVGNDRGSQGTARNHLLIMAPKRKNDGCALKNT